MGLFGHDDKKDDQAAMPVAGAGQQPDSGDMSSMGQTSVPTPGADMGAMPTPPAPADPMAGTAPAPMPPTPPSPAMPPAPEAPASGMPQDAGMGMPPAPDAGMDAPMPSVSPDAASMAPEGPAAAADAGSMPGAAPAAPEDSTEGQGMDGGVTPQS